MRKKRQREKQQQKEQVKQAEAKKRQEIRNFRSQVIHLVESLEETDGRALLQIDRIIERIGLDFALQKLEEAEQIEAQGGMMLPDESRKRTKGGVFFFLVKKYLKEEGRKTDMKEIFYKNQGEKTLEEVGVSAQPA
jgi:hypothetical protein